MISPAKGTPVGRRHPVAVKTVRTPPSLASLQAWDLAIWTRPGRKRRGFRQAAPKGEHGGPQDQKNVFLFFAALMAAKCGGVSLCFYWRDSL